MTTPDQPPMPPPELTPAPDSRLDQLAAELAHVDVEYLPLHARREELRDAIKAELLRAMPEGATALILTSPHLPAPLRYSSRTSWRFDSKACKAKDPLTYVKYAKQSTAWYLEAVKA